MGVVAGPFGEERSVEAECPVHLVGRDVMEPLAFPCAVPCLVCGFQQGQRAHDVGAGEREGIVDRTVHMAFGRQVDHSVDRMAGEQVAEQFPIADVALDEAVIGPVLDLFQVGEVARIGQLVEVHDQVVGIGVHQPAHHVRADETGAAGNEDVAFHHFCGFSRSRQSASASRQWGIRSPNVSLILVLSSTE